MVTEILLIKYLEHFKGQHLLSISIAGAIIMVTVMEDLTRI